MCWKYEDKYPGMCTDHIFWKDGAGVLDALEDWIGAKIDYEKAREGFESMLSKWHEKGIIKPK